MGPVRRDDGTTWVNIDAGDEMTQDSGFPGYCRTARTATRASDRTGRDANNPLVRLAIREAEKLFMAGLKESRRIPRPYPAQAMTAR